MTAATQKSRPMLTGAEVKALKRNEADWDRCIESFEGYSGATEAKENAERDMARHQPGWEVGTRAIMNIQHGELWKQDYDSFLDYIRLKLRKKKEAIYKAIRRLKALDGTSGPGLTALSLYGGQPSQNQLDALAKMPEEDREAVIAAAAAEGDVTPKGLRDAWEARHGDDDEEEAPEKDEETIWMTGIHKALTSLQALFGAPPPRFADRNLLKVVQPHINAMALAVAEPNALQRA